MSSATITLYLFHGNDQFAVQAAVRALREKMNDPAALNTSIHDASASAAEIIGDARSAPFLGGKRMVIVNGLLGGAGGKSKAKSKGKGKSKKAESPVETLLEGLKLLPESARLVFAEKTQIDESNPILQFAQQSETSLVKLYNVPKDLNDWLVKRVEGYGGSITPAAANALSEAISIREQRYDDKTRRGYLGFAADSECHKLVAYANGQTITEADVAALTAYVPEAIIWDIVEMLGTGQHSQAVQKIHRLLAEPQSTVQSILTPIQNQFRLLLQTRDLLDRGGSAQQLPELASRSFLAPKLNAQARQFSLVQLNSVYRLLLRIDWEIKTGRVDPLLALDLVLAQLA
jgi:DNA polymerase III subunit delta